MKDKMNSFSVSLGLFDYINPVCYTVTMLTIIRNVKGIMNNTQFICLLVGAILSIVFGLIIPTLKLLVGLGKLKFVMPSNIVFFVNIGILISGVSLITYCFVFNQIFVLLIISILIVLLALVYLKNKKFNTIAVLIGMFGYILIYTSLIYLSCINEEYICLMLYGIAVLIFLFLCFVGIKANLKDPKIHWIIEISNVICQALVSISTILLFL